MKFLLIRIPVLRLRAILPAFFFIVGINYDDMICHAKSLLNKLMEGLRSKVVQSKILKRGTVETTSTEIG